jgi:hypothetical protein
MQLLHGILLQEPGALTKPLRLLLTRWNFIIDKKEDKRSHHVMTTTSTNTKTPTTTSENLTEVEGCEGDDLCDSEEQQEYTKTTTGLLHCISNRVYHIYLC